jgi:hypothetical protein
VKYGAQKEETQERVMEETQYECLGRRFHRDYHRWGWLEVTRKSVNFGSNAKYHRWLAYGHMHHVFNGPGENVTIRRVKHKVKHTK